MTLEQKAESINQIYDVVRTQFGNLPNEKIVLLLVGAGVEKALAEEIVKRAKSGEVL